MKTNLINISRILIVILFISLPDTALGLNQKKKKEKKPKKEFVWDWDGKKTGVQEVDDYLLGCDSLWTGIENFRKDIDSYEYHDSTFSVNDKKYTGRIHDDTINKNFLSPGLVNMAICTIDGSRHLVGIDRNQFGPADN